MENQDKIDKKYKEGLAQIKKDKMNWEFEDFLKTLPNQSTFNQHTSLSPSKKPKQTLSKLTWLAAACLIIIAGFIFLLMPPKSEETFHKNTEIAQTDFSNPSSKTSEENSTLPIKKRQDPDSIYLKEPTEKVISEQKILDQIVSKKQRMRKNTKGLISKINKKPESEKPIYNANYVIINGQKIYNEQEAIDVTKFSFQLFSEKMNSSLVATVENNSEPND